jgi:hypothetical protein
VRDGAYELFAESVAVFPPLFPQCGDEDSVAKATRGDTPLLEELRLQQGTVWRWNRAVYDPVDGGHLRIELRALPAGPTPIDMTANAAFLIGLTIGLRDDVDRILPAFPFEYAAWNFYRAAQHGLDAELLWPSELAPSPTSMTARTLVARFVPVAARGLETLGVDRDEAARLLAVIAGRLETGQTGARWQRAVFDHCFTTLLRREALAFMMEGYMGHALSGRPVHEWEPWLG